MCIWNQVQKFTLNVYITLPFKGVDAQNESNIVYCTQLLTEMPN